MRVLDSPFSPLVLARLVDWITHASITIPFQYQLPLYQQFSLLLPFFPHTKVCHTNPPYPNVSCSYQSLSLIPTSSISTFFIQTSLVSTSPICLAVTESSLSYFPVITHQTMLRFSFGRLALEAVSKASWNSDCRWLLLFPAPVLWIPTLNFLV